MSKLFRCGASCTKSGSAHDLDNEEYDVVKKGKDLLTWNIPTLPTSKFYSRKLFDFSSDVLMKTKQGKGSLDKGGGYLNLFSEGDFWVSKGRPDKGGMVSWKLENEYHSIHVGMVQIGVKTITRKPLNASVILCLRDARHGNLQDSLLAMVEANLSGGPVYFNVFPNITESLKDPRLLNMLFLNAKVGGFEQLPEGPKNIILMYRVCFKVIKQGCGTRALLQSPTGRTVFFQTDFGLQSAPDQKVTEWDQVQLPENWPPPPKQCSPSLFPFPFEGDQSTSD